MLPPVLDSSLLLLFVVGLFVVFREILSLLLQKSRFPQREKEKEKKEATMTLNQIDVSVPSCSISCCFFWGTFCVKSHKVSSTTAVTSPLLT